MWLDVVDLNGFYRSQLGKVARHFIKAQIRQIWPNVKGQTVVGLGYATPYLKQFEKEAGRTLAIMPAQQGVTHWPREKANRVALSDEAALPFDDCSVDRLLLVHAVENAEHVQQMMREAWRVLAGNGRILIVAPSRKGFWARRDISPFGMGKPYSVRQLQKLLKETQFEPQQDARALYVPATKSGLVLHSAPVWERIGPIWFPRISGVVMVEARKQIYAASTTRRVQKRRLIVVPSAVREQQSNRKET